MAEQSSYNWNLHSNMVRFIIKFQQIDYFRQA